MQYETGGFDQCSVPTELTWQHSAALILLLPGKQLPVIPAWPVYISPEGKKCTKTLSSMASYHELSDAEQYLTAPVCGQVSEGSTALQRMRLNPRVESQHFSCVSHF